MKYRPFPGLFAVIIVSLLTVFPSGLSALAVTGRCHPVAMSRSRPDHQPSYATASKARSSNSMPTYAVVRAPLALLSARCARATACSITGRQTGWLQIVFSASPSSAAAGVARTIAWQLTANRPPLPVPRHARKQLRSPCRRRILVAYNDPSFSWQWDGANQMTGVNWYFDIQFFKIIRTGSYHVISAEPHEARLANGVWTFNQHVSPECDPYRVVQIAKRVDGAYAGWVSPKSNRLPIGDVCTVEGG